MSFKVTLEPSGHCFEVEADEIVLDAAIRKGLSVQYGCRNGVCGACKGKVVEGSIDYPNGLPGAVSEAEDAIGQALLCCARAASDLVIEMHEIGRGSEVKVRQLPSKVAAMEQLADDVMLLKLKLPEADRIQFLAGQYIDILLGDGRRRSFSIANAPHADEFIELHVRLVEGGEFTGHVFHTMKLKDILRVEGPFGNFTFSEESDRPMIFVAGGTGFGPIKGIIEHIFQENVDRSIHLYWGARDRAGLYLNELAEQWAGRDNVTYIPVLSEAKSDDHWSGRTGFVHQAVMDDFADLSGFDLYVSGPPAMVSAMRQGAVSKGLPNSQLWFDSFDFANDH